MRLFVTTHFSGISGGRELLAYRGEIDLGVPLDDRIESLDGTFTYPFRYGYACVGEADSQPVFAFHPHQNQFVARRDGCDRVRRVARRGGPRRAERGSATRRAPRHAPPART
jgi:hypothetical protein